MTRDRGSASVYVLAVSAVTLMVGLAAVAVGTAVVTRHRAEAAADLGAIAAASAALRGQPGACAQAGEVVRANGAKLTGCRLVGADARSPRRSAMTRSAAGGAGHG